MGDALRFLLAAEVVGLVALPVTRALLGGLPGGGLAFAKPLGLLLAAFPVWLLASLRIVPYGTAAVVGGVVLVALAGVVLRVRRGPVLPAGGDRRLLAGGELVFVAAFVLGALLVAHVPDVRGTEKPMDMAFLAAIDATDAFPPRDPWMAGESLNYYYLGQYLMAYVIRLAGVEPAVGYNLAVALLLALSAVAAYAVGASVAAASQARRPVLVGMGAAFLVCGAGNLDAAQRLLGLDGPLRTFDWFAPSRVIPDAITEFPAFSFVLGDLHAHVLAVPLTLLLLGFALQAALCGPRARDVPAAGLVLGVLYATNSWSYPVGAALLLAAPLLAGRDRRALVRAAAWGLGVLWVSVGAFLPFWLAFDPRTGGIADVEQRAGLGAFLADQALLIGVFAWILAAPFLARLFGTRRPRRTAALLAAGALAAVVVLEGAGLVGAALLVALLVVAARAALGGGPPAERFAWLLAAGGVACVLGPELFYVRDEFGDSALFRMNTIFKLGYQAWILLALAAALFLPAGRRLLPPAAWRLWAPGAVVLLVLAAAYPVAGSVGRTGGFAAQPSLDGRAWLEREAPGDAAAIDWLRANAEPGAVVLEAVGEDYSQFGHARISTFSGRPAVLGWAGHELQWGHDPGSRGTDVEQIYTTPLVGVAEDLLARYGVDYVVAGPLERTDYGEDELGKFDQLGRRVLERGGTTVWELTAARTPTRASRPSRSTARG